MRSILPEPILVRASLEIRPSVERQTPVVDILIIVLIPIASQLSKEAGLLSEP